MTWTSISNNLASQDRKRVTVDGAIGVARLLIATSHLRFLRFSQTVQVLPLTPNSILQSSTHENASPKPLLAREKPVESRTNELPTYST